MQSVGAYGHLDRLVFSFQKQVERVSGLVPLLGKSVLEMTRTSPFTPWVFTILPTLNHCFSISSPRTNFNYYPVFYHDCFRCCHIMPIIPDFNVIKASISFSFNFTAKRQCMDLIDLKNDDFNIVLSLFNFLFKCSVTAGLWCSFSCFLS